MIILRLVWTSGRVGVLMKRIDVVMGCCCNGCCYDYYYYYYYYYRHCFVYFYHYNHFLGSK